MKTEAELRAHIMRRVYVTYYMRAIAKPLPRVTAFAALAFALLGSVSIVNVFMNALNTQGLQGLVTFALSAFTETTGLVQFVTVALVAMVLWVVIDAMKHVRFTASPSKHMAPVQ